ncbi:MAG: outer membrane lipoprotein-sorting protein [Proteobacteria bacterium]|nr:outer membrane lipoprotein-sorting protein [Pseudomonadota bacterium]
MKTSHGSTKLAVLGTLLAVAGAASADPAKPSGDDVMKLVRDRKTPDNSYAQVELTIKKGDSTVEKVFKAWSLKVSATETRSLIEFEKPNNSKILAYSRTNGEDDRWIKTSSGQPKRISSSGGDGQTFAQSHFSYADLDFARAKGFTNELVCEAAKCTFDYQGAPHYKVKSTPTKGNGEYDYVVNFVRVSDSTEDRIEYFTKDGKKVKELTADDYKDVNGFKTPTVVKISITESGDSSTMKIGSIEYDSKKISAQMFDKNLL